MFKRNYLYKRFAEDRANEALTDTPVVLIVGLRRAGKTTLVRNMEETDRTYITLDDQTVLEAARADPAGFIRDLDRATIDEIQRAPELMLAIKKTVDEDYRPGQPLTVRLQHQRQPQNRAALCGLA